MRKIIILLLIILFSNLSFSYFQEGFECKEYDKDGACVKKKSNNFIVVVLLLVFIVWMVLVRQNA